MVKKSKPKRARPSGQRDVQVQHPRGFIENNQTRDDYDQLEEFLEEKMIEEGAPYQLGASRSGRATSLDHHKREDSANLQSRSKTKVTGPSERDARKQKDGLQGIANRSADEEKQRQARVAKVIPFRTGISNKGKRVG